MRLDEERIEKLRAWGAGLADDPREEMRAAGRAIVLLVEEIDRLQVDLWRSPDDGTEPAPAEPAATLRERLAAKLRTPLG